MFGFMIGTLCLFGLLGLVKGSVMHHRYGRYAHHSGRHCHPGRGEHGPRARGEGRRRGWGRAGFARAAGEVFKRRLDIDPDQEDIVDHALSDLQATMKELAATFKDSRGDLADAFAGDSVDESAIAAVFSRHDDELGRARHDAVSALKQVHAVLDPEQRARAAEWMGSGRMGWV